MTSNKTKGDSVAGQSSLQAISRWEIAGVPAAVIAAALYRLGVFQRMGFSAEDVPDLLLVAFVVVALVRMGVQAHAAKKV